jgi:hypothetical protein
MEIAGERHRKIKKIHRRASDVEKARALDYANEAGEALFLIKKDRQEKHDRDRSKMGWVKWARAELPFTYATANTYIRINYYWSDLEDLEERSIRGAIRRIQEIEGKAPRQRSRGRVKVKRAAFIAAAMKSGLSEIVANPNLGCAFFNEISHWSASAATSRSARMRNRILRKRLNRPALSRACDGGVGSI